MKTVVTDALSDHCTWACSTEGCRGYAMLVKHPIAKALRYSNYSITHERKKVLSVTHSIAQMLDVKQPSLAWLRHEMIGFNTFEALKLGHTCCDMDFWACKEKMIYERYTNEKCFETADEKAELVERLHMLLVEIEDKYNESGLSFSEFLDGCWSNRMAGVMSEEAPIDHKAMENL